MIILNRNRLLLRILLYLMGKWKEILYLSMLKLLTLPEYHRQVLNTD